MEESKVDIAENTSHEGHAGLKKKKKQVNMKNKFKRNAKTNPQKYVATAVIGDPA